MPRARLVTWLSCSTVLLVAGCSPSQGAHAGGAVDSSAGGASPGMMVAHPRPSAGERAAVLDPEAARNPIRRIDWEEQSYSTLRRDPSSAAREPEEDFEVTGVIYGDVDGDGMEEAVVAAIQYRGRAYLFLFALAADGVAVVERAVIEGDFHCQGAFFPLQFEGAEAVVERTFMADEDDTTECLPSQRRSERYRWTEGAFRRAED